MSLFPSNEKKIELLTRLRLLGVSEVRVEFSGGGDGGEISDITASSPQGEIDINKEEMVWEVEKSVIQQNNEWAKQVEQKAIPLPDIIEQITLEWLEETGHDWYNNDGGQGNMTIDFTESPPQFNLNVEINYTQTDEYGYGLNENDESVEG